MTTMTDAAEPRRETPIRGHLERAKAAIDESRRIGERMRRNLEEQRRLLERRRRAGR
jgi:hypothetical protein